MSDPKCTGRIAGSYPCGQPLPCKTHDGTSRPWGRRPVWWVCSECKETNMWAAERCAYCPPEVTT